MGERIAVRAILGSDSALSYVMLGHLNRRLAKVDMAANMKELSLFT